MIAIVTQYLFGSHARGDFTSGSDIDLLSIITEDRFGTFSEGKLNLSLYPMPKFIEAASRGNLFILHIVREAIVVYDPSKFHTKVIDKFRVKESYYSEIGQASDLGWYLVNSAEQFRDKKVWNKRVAWCVRTILIARSAERGKPVFSTQELSQTINFPATCFLLQRKNEDTFDLSTKKLWLSFSKSMELPLQTNYLIRIRSKPGGIFRKTAIELRWLP